MNREDALIIMHPQRQAQLKDENEALRLLFQRIQAVSASRLRACDLLLILKQSISGLAFSIQFPDV